MKIKLKGEVILIIGICLDMITTIIGTSYYNIIEGNIFPVPVIYLINFSVILLAAITINREKRPEFINKLFILIGGARILIAIYNTYLILRL